MRPEITATELEVGLLAVSAMLATRKRTPKAAKRCAKRIDRAMAHLGNPDVPVLAQAITATAAMAFVKQSCRACGLCKGR